MRKILYILFICSMAQVGMAQKTWNTRDSVARGVSITAGTGVSHYINTLQIDSRRVGLRQNFSCSSVRFMWEPEHRLSLGIEAGHYQIYEVQLSEGRNVNTASLSVTPILFCVQMRIFKRFYASAATGVSIHHALANALGNQSESSTMAFSNLQFSAGYIYPISKSFGLGLQTKFLSENKTEDMVFAVEAVARYQFKRRFKRIRERV
ncbi:hypothetical protein LV89_03583 [Arcicella aurantiaca]|uniref:Outer membrane protein with beta-barrel domain n=1 Tax=Arcicella aurantiaca TaxID=591202 RepID=A0A316EFZ9_9BACT|nr:hypothetical protein [Arcicella aurantiaca]PWK21870.1 hypothetical protein LV89_03583 [Arcicella aurantiaca]